MAGGKQSCMALDPIADVLASGKSIHRHCLLELGHEGMHQSRNPFGETVHEWVWDGEGPDARLIVQDELFREGAGRG